MTNDPTSLGDILDSLEDKYDFADSWNEDHRNRVVEEVLGGVDHFEKAAGPNGPWAYRSLTITREGNRILVKDVDGELARTLHLSTPENQVDDLHAALAATLDEIDEQTMEEL